MTTKVQTVCDICGDDCQEEHANKKVSLYLVKDPHDDLQSAETIAATEFAAEDICKVCLEELTNQMISLVGTNLDVGG